MSLILDGSNGLSDVDGTAATPAIRGTDTNTGIFFPAADTIAFSEGGTEAMRIDGSGNVGIGVTSPSQKLDVFGSVRLAFAGGNNYVEFESANNFIGRNSAGNLAINVASGQNIISSAGGTERMRLTSDGGLRLSTTGTLWSANERLTVQAVAAGSVATFRAQQGATEMQIIFVGTSNALAGYIQVGTTSTSYVTSSDYRLKENIAPMTGALAVVQQLKPVTYNWKIDGSSGQGFIAHELQEFVPDAVCGNKDDANEDGSIKPQGIDTSFLVATLTAAIQELKAELDTVKTELAALKA
jgi:hypothetical protein